jgi:hypothetical protein
MVDLEGAAAAVSKDEKIYSIVRCRLIDHVATGTEMQPSSGKVFNLFFVVYRQNSYTECNAEWLRSGCGIRRS